MLSLAPKSCEPCGSCVWTSWPFDDLNHVAFCFFLCLFFAVLIVLLFLGRSAFLTRHCLLPGALTPFLVALFSEVWPRLQLESAFFVCLLVGLWMMALVVVSQSFPAFSSPLPSLVCLFPLFPIQVPTAVPVSQCPPLAERPAPPGGLFCVVLCPLGV